MKDRYGVLAYPMTVRQHLHVNRPQSGLDYWRCREMTIESDPDRPVWADGECIGRTPVTATVLPGALAVVVP